MGRFLTQVLGMVYVAVLARYILAEGMGKIAIATSLVSILVLIINFGFSQLIVRNVASDRSKAGHYVSNALLLKAILSLIFFILILIVISVTRYPTDTTMIILIYSLSFVFDEFSEVIFSIFNAFEIMEYPAAIQTGRDITNIVLSLIAIYLHATIFALVFISVLASLLKLIVSLFFLRWRFISFSLQIDKRLCYQISNICSSIRRFSSYSTDKSSDRYSALVTLSP